MVYTVYFFTCLVFEGFFLFDRGRELRRSQKYVVLFIFQTCTNAMKILALRVFTAVAGGWKLKKKKKKKTKQNKNLYMVVVLKKSSTSVVEF
ncbi:hypothetical protein Hdeb2414_s0004g00122391 [Helianthus debilis subsp. tardiflorus]